MQPIKRFIVLAVILCGLGSSMSYAQSCMPDHSGRDTITKKKVDQWHQVLSSSGILRAALLGDDVKIIAIVGRSGDKNYIAIQISKNEENLARAAFESRYHAAKGDQFIFGLKDGEPLSFVANDVLNQAKAAGMFGGLIMTVILSADVPDKDMAALRDALTKKEIDAVRIVLSSGAVDVTVDKDISLKLIEKFECFYQTLDKQGIDLLAEAKQQSPNPTIDSPKGTDVSKGTPAGLTIDQIIKMVAAKVPDDIIITTIQASGTKFTLPPDDLIKLKVAGVSDDVIRAMSR